MDNPLVLTAVIVYVGVAGLGLATFPPLHWPTFVDLLRFHVLALLIARIALTHAYAQAAANYEMRMFLLELAIAFLFAAQLRLLDDLEPNLVRAQAEGQPQNPNAKVASRVLKWFYFVQFSVFLSMFVWTDWGSTEVAVLAQPGRYSFLRWAGLFSLLPAVGAELWCAGRGQKLLNGVRWGIAVTWSCFTLLYLLSRPWANFQPILELYL